VVAHPKIVPLINQQIGNEFSAMSQYYAIAAHFGAEVLPELAAHFRKTGRGRKTASLRFIQLLLDAGARVEIPGVPAPQAIFAAAEDAVRLSLEQEEPVTAHKGKGRIRLYDRQFFAMVRKGTTRGSL
jgi:ferritin